MEDTQDIHNQQQLEQQEQNESEFREWERYGTYFSSLIHSGDQTVFINFSAGSMKFALYVSKEIARQIGQDLIDKSRQS